MSAWYKILCVAESALLTFAAVYMTAINLF